MSTPEIARLLRAIADVIETSSPAEIGALARTLARPGSVGVAKKPTASRRAKGNLAADLASITRLLMDARDRPAAKAILADARLTRRDLARLGQESNVHIVKEDTVDVVETKIVEALVGSRLSSKAIRGDG